MLKLFQTAHELQKEFEKRKWQFCFIGGIALQRWGNPRLTVDIDITLLTGFGGEEIFVDELLKMFTSRRKNAKEFAQLYRILTLKTKDEINIDISLGALPFEEDMMKRASNYKFNEQCSLFTCSCEDLIILKAFANRPKDWIDIEDIIARQNKKFDKNYIIENLKIFAPLKDTPEIIDKFIDLLNN